MLTFCVGYNDTHLRKQEFHSLKPAGRWEPKRGSSESNWAGVKWDNGGGATEPTEGQTVLLGDSKRRGVVSGANSTETQWAAARGAL